jgi:hypothetical protein
MSNTFILDEISELRKLINDTNELNIALYKKLDILDKRINQLDNQNVEQIKKVKKKREPTAYNIFMKTKLIELKESHPSLSNIERMKMAAEAWDTSKLRLNC